VLLSTSKSYKDTISPFDIGAVRHRRNDVFDLLEGWKLLFAPRRRDASVVVGQNEVVRVGILESDL
jgi:hypothetical protein